MGYRSTGATIPSNPFNVFQSIVKAPVVKVATAIKTPSGTATTGATTTPPPAASIASGPNRIVLVGLALAGVAGFIYWRKRKAKKGSR